MVHWFMYKKIAICLCFTLFLGLLTACSPKGILQLKKSESTNAKTPNKSKKPSENTGISSPIAIPPSFNDKPPKPGQIQTQYMPNGLPALSPMKGVNVDTLFSEKIKNSDKRFSRVENAVVDLRKEFETYKPAIVRLAAVESDIQSLIKELEVLLQETPADQQLEQPMSLSKDSEALLQVAQLEPQPTPPPEQEKLPQAKELRTSNLSPTEKAMPPPDKKPPEKIKTKPKIMAQSPPETVPQMPKYKGTIAKDLRAGEHADKIRIVIDTNKRTDFNIDLDNDEKLIIIELPNAKWIGNKNHNFKDSKLLESYTIEPINNGKGSMIVLSLKNKTSIIREKRLSPDKQNPYQRIYFDLKI